MSVSGANLMTAGDLRCGHGLPVAAKVLFQYSETTRYTKERAIARCCSGESKVEISHKAADPSVRIARVAPGENDSICLPVFVIR